MAANVPIEILEHIMSYLRHEDYYACLSVCRRWYSVFCDPAYKTITIHTRPQCRRFVKAIAQAIRKQSPFIRYIQHVLLEHTGQKFVVLKSRELDILLIGLVNLKQLDFSPLLWQQLDYASLTRAVRTVPLLSCQSDIRAMPLLREMGVQLRELSISADIFNLLHAANEWFNFLLHMRHIESLKIMAIEPDRPTRRIRPWCLIDMEIIHTLLPQLSSLHLEGAHLSAPEENATDPVSTSRLKRLHLECTPHDAQWIRYATLKYPTLTHMSLNVIDKGALISDTQTDTLFWNAIMEWVKTCPTLVSLVFGGQLAYRDIPERHLLFAHLAAHRAQLKELRFPDGIELSLLSADELQQRLRVFDPKLKRFSLRLLVGDTLQPIRSIALTFPFLTSLDVVIKTDVIDKDPKHVLDHILEHCRSLTTLVCTMTYANPLAKHSLWISGNKRTHTALTNIEFKSAVFEGSFFDALARRCPNLIHLKLLQCDLWHSHADNAYMLDFSHHRFDRIVFDNIHCIEGSVRQHKRSLYPPVLLETRSRGAGQSTRAIMTCPRAPDGKKPLSWPKSQNQVNMAQGETNKRIMAKIQQDHHVVIRCQYVKIFEYTSPSV